MQCKIFQKEKILSSNSFEKYKVQTSIYRKYIEFRPPGKCEKIIEDEITLNT